MCSETTTYFVKSLKLYRRINRPIYNLRTVARRLGGVVVSVLVTGPKVCGFRTRPRRWVFKGHKNPQHTFLSDGK
jgi:hypothetical protein